VTGKFRKVIDASRTFDIELNSFHKRSGSSSRSTAVLN